MQHNSLKTLFAAALTAVVLAACGGGGGGGSNGATQPPAKQLTGRAIDGYLVNAKVCFDDGHGGCDPSFASTVTAADGSYKLAAPADAVGRRINVIVTPDTIDASTGTKFTSTFTLSAIVDGDAQNVTPLTTLVVAQVASGKSRDDALVAVRTVTGTASTDPAADYIASGDTATATVASSMVAKLTALSGQGPISWSRVQATMLAYADLGNVDGVQQADVNNRLAASSVSTDADASSVLASSLYTVDGDLMQWMPGTTSTGYLTPVRERSTLSGSTLGIVQEEQHSGSWEEVQTVGSYDAMFSGTWISLNGGIGAYVMQANGAWSDWKMAYQMHPNYALSTVGAKLIGTDPLSNDQITVSYKTIDMGGQSLASSLHIDYRNPVRGSMLGSFPTGTTGYLASMAYANDRVMLPSYGIGPAWLNGASVAGIAQVNGMPQYVLGDPNATHASVQEVVGMQVDIGYSCVLLNILPNGVAQVDKSNKEGCNYANVPLNYPVTGSWSVYPRNPQVITINLPKSIAARNIAINDRVKNAIGAGGSLVVALVDNHLMSGYLQPAGSPVTSLQLRADAVDQVAASMREAAVRIGQNQNP